MVKLTYICFNMILFWVVDAFSYSRHLVNSKRSYIKTSMPLNAANEKKYYFGSRINWARPYSGEIPTLSEVKKDIISISSSSPSTSTSQSEQETEKAAKKRNYGLSTNIIETRDRKKSETASEKILNYALSSAEPVKSTNLNPENDSYSHSEDNTEKKIIKEVLPAETDVEIKGNSQIIINEPVESFVAKQVGNDVDTRLKRQGELAALQVICS
jgi:hypothetical protein